MKDPECREFLQWCLPRLRYRWSGFRKVRKQVCKRLGRRIGELGLEGLIAYREYLGSHPEEWQILDSLCRITISCFYRDRSVFNVLRTLILPSLARRALKDNEKEVRCWSAGCCSGEEPYTLQILWKSRVMPAEGRDIPLRIIATDTDEELLERAERGFFTESSLRDLPLELIRQSFCYSGRFYSILKDFRQDIEFVKQDIRKELPCGSFHLILCRNLVFTYFDEAEQRKILDRIIDKLLPGGFLITGIHEALPRGEVSLKPCSSIPGIYQKTSS
jgi:chemotaxis protein methyltransferase CheR